MKATVPAPAAALLNYIAAPESGGNYLAYYGHGKSTDALPPTVGAVLAWQKTLKESATGRYQIIRATLTELCTEYAIPTTEPFTNDLQDELGFYLLVKRGYDHWVAGSLTDAGFADALSQEWASLPYKTGKSYYDGDGLNHSLVTRPAFLAAIAAAKKTIVTGPAVAAAPTPPVKEVTMTDTVSPTPIVTTSATPITTPKPDLFQSIIQTAENYVTQIESAIKVVVSPNNTITASGTGAIGSVFNSVGEAQTCISDIMSLIEDAKAKNATAAIHDVINFAETLFQILANFGVSIPGLSMVDAALVALDPVKS